MKGFSYEKRYLKKPKLGPPDVYPQEPKQKEASRISERFHKMYLLAVTITLHTIVKTSCHGMCYLLLSIILVFFSYKWAGPFNFYWSCFQDELTIVNVKHGFTIPQLAEEFGSARNFNVTASKVGAYFNAILEKKDEFNTLPDSGRKRQQINPKDNFWPATARTKPMVETWFKDLAGTKALVSLSKKAPNFNKKEDIYQLLCDFQVPMLRAAWFIKLSSAYTVAVTEAKGKKRQLPDPTQEWTQSLLKFMKEHLSKLQEFYQNASQSVMSDDQKMSLKLWQYTQQLTRYLYQEGLLDRQETLQWILDLLERYKNWPPSEDGPLRLILPLALQYLEEFVQNELLARKLAYFCVGRLTQLCMNQTGSVSPNSPNHNASQSTPNNAMAIPNAVSFTEFLNCVHHKDIILSLSVIIQVITLDCPTALVWNSIGEGKSASIINGSPLDHLPCTPLSLPMPQRNANPHIRYRHTAFGNYKLFSIFLLFYSTSENPSRAQLKAHEEMIKQRSQAAENKWSCDKWQQSCAGVTTQRVLAALDALDRHSFYKVDTNNSLSTLYSKIFPEAPDKNNHQIEKDEPIVNLLCWWAVSGNRYGEHRAIAVAKLLERRNNQVMQGQDGDNTDDKDSVTSVTTGLPVFQPLLMKFLDHDAPILEESNNAANNASNRIMFTNLVHLFSELVRHDVFSHDAYVCTLISRGDLLQVQGQVGGKVKKHSRSEFNFEATTARVQSLSFFDQHVVTSTCSTTVYEMISAFGAGTTNYLPVQEHVAFLFDLMELALNIHGLIDICIQVSSKQFFFLSDDFENWDVFTYLCYFCATIAVCCVSIFRSYFRTVVSNLQFLSGEQTVSVFEGLCRVVINVSNPGDCSSAERCVLSHLHDLYASCSLLKTRPHGAEPFSNAYPKIRTALYSSLTPSQLGNQTATPFLADVIKSCRKAMKIEPAWVRQLNDSLSNRYSFVWNAIMAVCSSSDIDRLNDLGHLCAELTSSCNMLSSEWLGVLTALCYSSKNSSYINLLDQINIHELAIHNSLAVFTSILVARHCFSLEDFVVHAALPSLMTMCNEGRGDDIDAEAGARLTCHLLLRLFKTSEVPQPAMYSVATSPHPLPSNSASSIKLSCDRHLLAAAHNNIKVGPVLAVLKAQRLLHMICYPDRPLSTEASMDQKAMITNILENLELWTMRVSWLDMQLMLKQFAPASSELNQWLETVAKAAINLFNLNSANKEDNTKGKNQCMWLVAPLVAKLPPCVQGRVLKVAGQVLVESCNWFTSSSSRNKGGTPSRPSGGPQMGHHQPFLALVLTCLKGQDDQREGLLTSLHAQLTQCIQMAKEDRNYVCGDHKSRTAMQDALLLRFSLIGGMFDTIQRNTNLTIDWAILLVQLVIYGVIDLNNNWELFNTVIDMLATLIHSTLVSDSQSEKCEENRKHYQNLMKKLKKEVGERNSPSIHFVRQLLPLPKRQTEVIACGQMGLLTDMKGNKIDFDSTDKHGLQVTEKQRISPWDILEGLKNPAPLSWSWFGAVRMDRRLLPFEETHRLLQCHTHSLVKSPDHYLEPLPLPPEDIDPPKPAPNVTMTSMGGPLSQSQPAPPYTRPVAPPQQQQQVPQSQQHNFQQQMNQQRMRQQLMAMQQQQQQNQQQNNTAIANQLRQMQQQPNAQSHMYGQQPPPY
ncbi:unnamed protein product [Nesidiocoris tenuis]|uniref:Mediator complex subunit Med12 domain-containing protein n=1 Tax=Nesidiocoris tenuis TaxID=355587 RepID=A0A6H5HCH8_9HEMI|nr:unnamed protein product [Nesidiocoris tenuis]